MTEQTKTYINATNKEIFVNGTKLGIEQTITLPKKETQEIKNLQGHGYIKEHKEEQ